MQVFGFLVFLLVALPITKNGILKFPTVTVKLFLPSVLSVFSSDVLLVCYYTLKCLHLVYLLGVLTFYEYKDFLGPL